jgi:hypothetical protein
VRLTIDPGGPGARPGRIAIEQVDRAILLGLRSAMPAPAPRLGFFAARRDKLRQDLATGVTALAAFVAILIVAAAAVVVALG